MMENCATSEKEHTWLIFSFSLISSFGMKFQCKTVCAKRLLIYHSRILETTVNLLEGLLLSLVGISNRFYRWLREVDDLKLLGNA